MQEIYHFLQRFFCLILSGYILKGNTGRFLHIHLGIALADTHDAASAAHPFHGSTKQDPHDGDRDYKAKNLINPCGCSLVLSGIIYIVLIQHFIHTVIFQINRIIGHLIQALFVLYRLDLNLTICDDNTFYLIILDHLLEFAVCDLLIGKASYSIGNHCNKQQHYNGCDHEPEHILSVPASIIVIAAPVVSSVFVHTNLSFLCITAVNLFFAFPFTDCNDTQSFLLVSPMSDPAILKLISFRTQSALFYYMVILYRNQ